MKEYITTAIVKLFTGMIGLSEKQARRRSRAIEPVDGQSGIFRIVAPVELKAGEVILLDNPDKVTLSKLDLTEKGLAQASAEEADRIRAEVDRRMVEEKEKERLDSIVAACRTAILNGDLTSSGLPEVKAVEELLGFDITADERNRAVDTISLDH